MIARVLILNEVSGSAQGQHMTNVVDIIAKMANW